MLDLKQYRIAVTGGSGFLGRHVVSVLRSRGVRADAIFVPRSRDYDLTREADVERFFNDAAPDIIFHLAGEVGGIAANRKRPGRFFYANMAMGLHLIEHARHRNVKKFIQVGTVCSYPKFSSVPFKEEDLWNGYPEETNAPYGIAKRTLFAMLDSYYQEYGLRSAVVLPVNLFGPHDNFDLASSHVIPALIRKFEEAQRCDADHVTCWGTGSATREFLYVTDAAEGIVRAAERVDRPIPINLGTGQEIAIRKLATKIAFRCEYEGRIEWDQGYPDGQPRRCLDTTRASSLLDWTAETSLDQGLDATIRWYRLNVRPLNVIS